MLRYSLGGLLVAVLAVSVGCAALVNPSPLWSQIVFTGTVVILLAATVGATVGGPRPVAAGLAIFGWGYLLLTSGPWAASVRPHLLTEAALVRLEPLVLEPAVFGGGGFGAGGGYGGGGFGGAPWNIMGNMAWTPSNGWSWGGFPSEESTWLRQIGHTLWALVFGVAGGALARVAARRRKEEAVLP